MLFEIFYNFLTARWTVSNMYAQVAKAQSCANHLQYIECLSLTELKSHLFELYFIGWTIKPMEEGRKLEYPEKTPDDELQKMPENATYYRARNSQIIFSCPGDK